MDHRYFLRLACASSLVLATACRPLGRSPTASSSVLHVGSGTEPASLDPQIVDGKPEADVLLALFEGLTVPDPKTAQPRPGVAYGWRISSDGLDYVFDLREDLHWSNGDPLTAKDFIYSVRRALSPGLGNPWTHFFFSIRNAEAYFNGNVSNFSEVGIQAIDDFTLEIFLERPNPYFLELLMHNCWYPVHRGTIEKFGKIDERDTRWTRPGNMVSNGPFMLKSWENGSCITVVKNPHYWDRDNVHLKKIYFHPVSDTATEERMFAARELDITNKTHVSKISHHLESGDLYMNPHLGCTWVIVNYKRKPFDDIRVRRALAMAVNRKEIGKMRGLGEGLEAYGAVPPGILHYRQQEPVFREDVQEAKRLLAEAGYPNGKGFPRVEILYNLTDANHLVFEALQAMWEKNLGLHFDLVGQEWKVYLSLRHSHDFTLARFCWVGDYNDPMTMLSIFQSENASNDTQWSSVEFDYRLRQVQYTTDEEKRIQLLQEAERILMEDMVAIPLFWMSSEHLVSPRVKGWYPNVMDYHPWKYVSKSR